MPMNGEYGRSGSMKYGGARAEGIGVSTGARATIFVTGDEQQENTNQKEEQQTSKKNANKDRQSASTKRPALN